MAVEKTKSKKAAPVTSPKKTTENANQNDKKTIKKTLSRFLFSLAIIGLISAILFGFILPKTRVKVVPSNDFSNSVQITYQVENEGDYSEETIIDSVTGRIEAAGVVNYSIDYAAGIEKYNIDYITINIPIPSKRVDWHIEPDVFTSASTLTDTGYEIITSLVMLDVAISQNLPIEFRGTDGVDLFDSNGNYLESESSDLLSPLINEEYVIAESSASVVYQNSNPLVSFKPYSEAEWLTMSNGQIAKSQAGETDEAGNPVPSTAQFVDVWLGYDLLTKLLDSAALYNGSDNYTRCFAQETDETGMPIVGNDIRPVCKPFYLGRMDLTQGTTVGSKSSNITVGYKDLTINQVNWFVNMINFSTMFYSMTFVDSHFVDPTFSFWAYYILFLIVIVALLTAMIYMMKRYGYIGSLFALLGANFIVSNYLLINLIGIPLTMANIIVFYIVSAIGLFVIFSLLRKIKEKLSTNFEVPINKLVNKSFAEVNSTLGTAIFIIGISAVVMFILTSISVQLVTLTILLGSFIFYAIVMAFGYGALTSIVFTKEANEQRDVTKRSKMFGAIYVEREERHIKLANKMIAKDVKRSPKQLAGLAFAAIGIGILIFGISFFILGALMPISFSDASLRTGPVVQVEYYVVHEKFGSQYPLSPDGVTFETGLKDEDVVNAITAELEAALDEQFDFKIENSSYVDVSSVNLVSAVGVDLHNVEKVSEYIESQRFYGATIYFDQQSFDDFGDDVNAPFDAVNNIVADLNERWMEILTGSESDPALDLATPEEMEKYDEYDVSTTKDVAIAISSFYIVDQSVLSYNIGRFIFTFFVFMLIGYVFNIFVVGKDGADAIASVSVMETLSFIVLIALSFPVLSVFGFSLLYLVLMISATTKLLFVYQMRTKLSLLRKKHYTDQELIDAINFAKPKMLQPMFMFFILGVVFALAGLLFLNLTLVSMIWFFILPIVICTVYSFYFTPVLLKAKVIKRNATRIASFEQDKKLTEDPDLLEEKLVEGVNY